MRRMKRETMGMCKKEEKRTKEGQNTLHSMGLQGHLA